MVIQSFALSLITIFVPIYLIKLGYSLNQALIFVMVELGTLSFFSPLSAVLAQRFGFKHIILYRMPLFFAYFGGLYALPYLGIPIYLIALCGGIGGSIYWLSLHSLFAKHSDKLHRGTQTGKLMSMPQIASLFGPSIGGVIAVSLGFKALFAIAMMLLAASAVPLFFTGDMKPHVKKFSFWEIFAKKRRKFILAFAAQGTIKIARTVIWPIFVYFTLKDVASVGFVATTVAVGAILFTLYIGRISDAARNNFLIKTGGVLLASTFFYRIYATSAPRVFVVSFLSGLFSVLIDLPMLKGFYDTANNEDLTEIVILREIGLGIGKVASILILLVVLNKFTVGFSMGAIASLVFSLF
jgi:MFS family permease